MNARAHPGFESAIAMRLRRWLGALLIVALLGAQWLGVQHQILHDAFGAVDSAALAARPAGVDLLKGLHQGGHSCVLFDAATLCHGPPTLAMGSSFVTLLRFVLNAARMSPPVVLPLPRRFLTRAPPFFHA